MYVTIQQIIIVQFSFRLTALEASHLMRNLIFKILTLVALGRNFFLAIVFAFDEGERILILLLLAGSGQTLF